MQIAGFIYTAVLLQHIIKKNLISEYFKGIFKTASNKHGGLVVQVLGDGTPSQYSHPPPPPPHQLAYFAFIVKCFSVSDINIKFKK